VPGPGPIISRQKVLAAAQGNTNLLEVLQQIAQTTEQQQIATGTAPRAGGNAGVAVAGPAIKKVSVSVPPQATGTVSMLGGAYVVQLVNPGAASPVSRLQAAQAAGRATQLTPLQPIISIYHQIRVSTSPAFNVNSNTQTFGGNTGSTQTYWTLTGLGTGTWYVQFRSSYDGVNFNTWKNANSGTALGGLVNQVTTENAGNSEWALLTLPGSLIMGVGAGIVADATVFDLPSQLVSSGMLAIAGPNGYTANNNAVYGVTLCDVDIQVPSTGLAGVTGAPDFPVEIRMQYGVSGSSAVVPGLANVFAIGFAPTDDENVTFYEEGGASGAVWSTVRLPGGARVAIGQGKNAHGAHIWVPASLAWISGTRMISICSLTDAVDTSLVLTGYNKNQLSGLTMQAQYLDAHGATFNTSANWLAVAWEAGTDVEMVAGANFLKFSLQGGHALVIGAGQCPTSTPITLPAGYTYGSMVGIVTPASSDNSGHHLRGIAQCAFFGLDPILVYSDNSNTWGGDVNWMVAAWK
jgi:hypothetical protein